MLSLRKSLRLYAIYKLMQLCITGIQWTYPYEQNFDHDKSRQTFHHSLKEHHKISNIPKFRCELML
jgi:hypothetical protein